MSCVSSPSGRLACPRCRRPVSHCLCAHVRILSNRTRVIVLQHPDEARHPLNTARLAVLGLADAELHVGLSFPSSLWEDEESWLLFPPEAGHAGTAAPGARPRRLIVPDGTWRQARRLVRTHPGLAALPRLPLPPGRGSRYTVRRACFESALATIEAIAAALDTLDAPARHDALLAPFTALVEGQLAAARGAAG
ncbi:DTW domain-containing protein [Verticiella sediminum]|uniref:tRNA-uridine aminocarboxypropyltransferase n=2 Tax=Verticiella sediminum TaxID=1247510 RepID=A0A556AXN0_9BURK|nr:tRNA-uridine aminocarboxypropyltransferase [Verticiella sediminum]TSH97678.1 DTW domain-containing protein [Verticiella sediminum]